jgi:hypothetical protein
VEGALPTRLPLIRETATVYFQDLVPYSYYLVGTADANLLAVGWLDAEHEYPRGPTPMGALERVLALCFQPVNQTRGFHASPFLKPAPFGYRVEYQGKTMLLGSAEIRVPGRNGKSYAAPNLIYHFIKDCGYQPPQEFLDALMDRTDS